MEATTAHHGRDRNTAEATGAERVSKARGSKAEVEIETAETARARAVEKAAVAEMGKRSTAVPPARALVKAKAASPHAMQARV
jgi:hypothetical protein